MASSPKHAWKYSDRIGLCLLVILFQNSIRDVTSIFNYIQKEVLTLEGFEAGMSPASIRSQIGTMKLEGGTGNRIYSAMSTLPYQELESRFREQKQKIEDAAKAIGITLMASRTTQSRPLPPPPAPPNPSPERRRARATSNTETSSWRPGSGEGSNSNSSSDSDSDASIVIDLETPTRAPRRPTQHIGLSLDTLPTHELLSPMIPGRIQRGVYQQRRPQFIFRAYEVSHGLRARRFLSTPVTAPPAFQSNTFSTEVKPHLDRDVSYTSPFLSFAQNPAVSIRYAFANTIAHKIMAMAIFNYDDIRDDLNRRFGVRGGPHLVPVICKAHHLDDLPGGYTGTGEFLVWGSVHAKPVATIAAAETLMIRAIMRTTHTINAEAGTRLAKHLPTSMTDQELELFLYKLVTGFKIRGHETARKTQGYFDFVAAATSGRAVQQDQAGIESPIVDYQMTDGDGEDDDCVIIEETSTPHHRLPVRRMSEWEDDSDSDWDFTDESPSHS